jgi:hypothetical protein
VLPFHEGIGSSYLPLIAATFKASSAAWSSALAAMNAEMNTEADSVSKSSELNEHTAMPTDCFGA